MQVVKIKGKSNQSCLVPIIYMYVMVCRFVVRNELYSHKNSADPFLQRHICTLTKHLLLQLLKNFKPQS